MFINLMQSRLFTEKNLKGVSLKDFKVLNWLYTWLHGSLHQEKTSISHIGHLYFSPSKGSRCINTLTLFLFTPCSSES